MHHEREQNERDCARAPFQVEVAFSQVFIVSEAGDCCYRQLLSLVTDDRGRVVSEEVSRRPEPQRVGRARRYVRIQELSRHRLYCNGTAIKRLSRPEAWNQRARWDLLDALIGFCAQRTN